MNITYIIGVVFSTVFIFLGSEMSFYIFGNSKSAELAENFSTNLLMIELPLLLLIWNAILHTVVRKRIDLPDAAKAKRYGILITVFSLVYWVGVTLFTVLSKSFSYPANIFLAGGAVFVVIIVPASTAMPRTTAMMMATGLRTSFSTAFLYLFVVALKAVLNEAWKRSITDIFFSWPSWSWGFRKMAHRAGDSVRAFRAEMKMATAIVTPNSR